MIAVELCQPGNVTVCADGTTTCAGTKIIVHLDDSAGTLSFTHPEPKPQTVEYITPRVRAPKRLFRETLGALEAGEAPHQAVLPQTRFDKRPRHGGIGTKNFRKVHT